MIDRAIVLARHSLQVRILVFCLLLATPSACGAQTSGGEHAHVSLISDEGSIAAGHSMWIGVLFRLDKGWHVYWQNPGDSGEPPRIEWRLPQGTTVGAIKWPRPVRLGSGSVIDYGYENEVLLMAPMVAGASPELAQVTIEATVKYVVCREICVPGKEQLSLSLPRAQSTAGHFTQWHNLFEQTRSELPKPAPANWKISVTSGKNDFVLAVQGVATTQEASFLPLDASVIDNSVPQILSRTARGFRLTLQKSDQLQAPLSMLRGLIVLGNNSTAYEITASITPPR